LPIASDDRKFCNFYAGLASAAAAVAQEQNCGFDSSSGRWSTDNESHFNWCLGQFQAAAGVADRLAAARNLANSEEAARNTGVQQCQASAAASQAQLEYDIQVTGKTAAQCQGSHDNCVARARGLGSLNSPAAIASCAPILQACMSNAAAAQKAYTDQRSYEIQVTGKSAGECQSTYQSCEARVRATYGPVNAPVQIAAECAPSLPVCLANAAAALAAAAPGDATPAPGEEGQPPTTGGGGLTASTCGLSGTATVVIPDPTLTTLNVRDKPNGNILSKIPENAQVEVMGPCGVKLSAGIVAQKPGQVIPGWCAISTPQVTGCVSEQFLVAGIPAGGPLGAGSAGIVATEPQSAAAPTFTGTWNAEAQGSGYTFMLNQDGNTVAGSYSGGDGSNGQLNGSVSGNVLRFAWRQTDGVSGAGKFTLSGDGNSFNGSYTLSSDPDVAEGSWNGTRQ
jgi:hypothetical protein